MKLARDQATLAKITALIEYAFQKKHSLNTDPVFLARYEHADAYGVYQGDELTNLIMANQFTSQYFSKSLKMAGVGYVASYPEYRGQGTIAKLMGELLHDLYENGVAVSQLAPFSEAFYRQFGYENTSQKKNYQIPVSAFAHFKSERQGFVKRGTWRQLEKPIKDIYQSLLPGQVGTLIREDWWWERLAAYYPDRFYAVAFDDEKRAVGYLIYRMQGATLVLDELAYQNDFAVRKLLTYVKAHTSSFEEVVYSGPAQALLESYFGEQQELAITLRPYMMSRIIDIKQVLQALPLQQKVIIEVTEDKQCPWNVGSWLVDQGTCQKVKCAGDVQCSIQSLSELLLGGLTLDEAVFLGKVKVTKQFASDPFPKGQQSFYDYF